jgi:site-specific DNA recombinase
MNRPAFQQMLEDSKKGDFQAIIVHKLDRFSRNTVDTLSTIDELKSRGIDVVSAYEHLEENPVGRVMLNIISSFSEYYISNLANEVSKGQRENAYKCKANGGIGCLGVQHRQPEICNQRY